MRTARDRRAPEGFRSCVYCLKGDTETAVLIEGEAEWCAAALSVFAGIDVEEAQATLLVYAEQELACEPGTVPDGRIEFTFRLCRDCARRTDVEVTKGEVGRVYAQPWGENPRLCQRSLGSD